MKTAIQGLLSLSCAVLFFAFNSPNTTAAPISVWLECPHDVTVNCTDDLSNLDKWGKAWLWENYVKRDAPPPKVTKNTNSCGIGTITRTWEYEDKNWHFHSCSQTITILGGGTPFGYADIIWPKSLEIEGCNPNADPGSLPKGFNYPTFNKRSCSQPMYTYKDMKFTVADGCMKILRDWKVIDWCQYIPNAKYPTGIWTYTQVIKLVLKDSTAYLKCPKDTVVQASLDCKGTFVKLDSAKGFTKCGYLLKIRNTSPYAKSGGPDASGDYPLGTTKFYFIAEYGCGVELKCEVKVTVVNKIPPTPYCLTGIIVALMPVDSNRDGTVDAGMIEVWAKDLDHGSYHKCGYKNLRFSFSSDVREMNRIFTCDQLGKNEVEMWVTDSAGNQSFCKTIIEIQNNNARIPDCKRKDSLTTRPPTLSINGQVLLENKSGQKEVKLSLLDMTSFKISITKDTIPFIRYDTIRASSGTIYYIQKRDTIFKEKRDTVFGVMAEEKMNREDGNFAFIDVKKDKDYMVVPKSTKEDLEGIDVYDAIVLLRHVLGSQKITSPYKILAADVNNDGQITHADFDLLYSIINGTKSLNQIPRKWRFVPTAYNFQSPTNPLAENIPEYIIYKSLKSSREHSDFIAIKIGELDDSKTTLTAKELSTRENDFIETNKTLSQSALSINNLFPNPLSQGPFQMDIFVPKPSKLSLTLFNVEGKSLQKFTQTFESGNQQWILEPERELPNGVIFYNLTDGKVHLYGKIQISK
ncbi:MAG: hypothetical protein IPO72_06760 [Saprospiraceae bacterium]|nr:hypothetical protein [Candidatus Vicinibacter affinis]